MEAGPELVLRVDGAWHLSAASVRQVTEVCDQVEDSGGADVLVVRLSGAPLGVRPPDLTTALVTKWERVLRRLEKLPITKVALVSGDCGGQALDVLLATDVRIATRDTRLLVPVHGGATWPGMALYRLVQQAGYAAVRRAVLLGAPIEAGEALALRLVDELTDDPAEALAAVAASAVAISGSELAIRRQLMADASVTSFEDALGAHLAACDRALRREAAS
jgi:isomerase DpgB